MKARKIANLFMFWRVLFICRMKAYREQNVNVRRNKKKGRKSERKIVPRGQRETPPILYNSRFTFRWKLYRLNFSIHLPNFIPENIQVHADNDHQCVQSERTEKKKRRKSINISQSNSQYPTSYHILIIRKRHAKIRKTTIKLA